MRHEAANELVCLWLGVLAADGGGVLGDFLGGDVAGIEYLTTEDTKMEIVILGFAFLALGAVCHLVAVYLERL